MTVKELKEILNKYDDNLEVNISELSDLGSYYKIHKIIEFIDDDEKGLFIVTNSCNILMCDKVKKSTKERECSICGKMSEILVTHTEGFVCTDCIKENINKQTEQELNSNNKK